jgi:hypothetical protein
VGQTGFFDLQNRLDSLDAMGDPLEALNQVIPWEDFRSVLRQGLLNKDRNGEFYGRKLASGGRPSEGADEDRTEKLGVQHATIRTLDETNASERRFRLVLCMI